LISADAGTAADAGVPDATALIDGSGLNDAPVDAQEADGDGAEDAMVKDGGEADGEGGRVDAGDHNAAIPDAGVRDSSSEGSDPLGEE
jgi:hypothetical protein